MSLEYPAISKPVPAKYQDTTHGGKSLIDTNNYLYIKSKAVKERIYWMCQRARSKTLPYCPGKAVTIGDEIQWANNHNHGADPVSLTVRAAEKRVLDVSFHLFSIDF
jgi:hypothetical protein